MSPPSVEIGSAIGIVAGSGRAPLYMARAARARYEKVALLTFDRATLELTRSTVDVAEFTSPFKVSRIFEFFRSNEISQIVFIGKVDKRALYSGIAIPDARAISVLKKIYSRGDDQLLDLIGAEFESEGFRIVSQFDLLSDYILSAGLFSARAPTESERADIDFGMRLARSVASLGIGQTVVVKERAPIAIEAIEGTDETILRAGALAGRSTVVCKALRPHQDRRFDIPTIGLETIETLKRAKAAVLAVEAGASFVFEREKAIEAANRAGLVLIGVRIDSDSLERAG